MKTLDERIIQIYKETSNTLTGSDRRAFQAKIAKEYLGGKPTRAESVFGWGRSTVELGLKELETGYTCYVEIHERGNKKTEERLPELEQDIRVIVEPHGQVDPKFKTSLLYTRITAKAVRKALMDFKGYTNKELPTERTITNILNRLSYTLKRVLKTKPLKKIKETCAIFKKRGVHLSAVTPTGCVLRHGQVGGIAGRIVASCLQFGGWRGCFGSPTSCTYSTEMDTPFQECT